MCYLQRGPCVVFKGKERGPIRSGREEVVRSMLVFVGEREDDGNGIEWVRERVADSVSSFSDPTLHWFYLSFVFKSLQFLSVFTNKCKHTRSHTHTCVRT